MSPSYRPEEDVVEICRDLIRIDSTNYGDGSGPGERQAAEYVAGKLADVGIESELFEPAKGRTSLVARWGNPEGSDRLLVHGHLDVVPAAKQDWKVDPFAGEVADDYLWGRGAVDMKDFDAAILSVVRARTRAGVLPKRPVTLVFTADEEAGGVQGAHAIVDQRPEWLEGCTEGIGEVGGVLDNHCRQANLPDRDRREGDGLAPVARQRHCRSRLDAQHRQRRHGDHRRSLLRSSAATSGRSG